MSVQQKIGPHPTPEAALSQLEGLTSDDLLAIIKHAVNHGTQMAAERDLNRYYLAELAGFKYNFHYSIQHKLGASYRLRDSEASWAVEFVSSGRLPKGDFLNSPYIIMPVVTVTPRVCFGFTLHGDKDQFRHDMSKLKLFL